MISKADESAVKNCAHFTDKKKNLPGKNPTVFIELPENLQKITRSKLCLSLELSHKRFARHPLGVVAKMNCMKNKHERSVLKASMNKLWMYFLYFMTIHTHKLRYDLVDPGVRQARFELY